MPILVGIDGTGDDPLGSDNPTRNQQYDDTFATSFVRRICRPGLNTMYFRGPGWVPAGNGLMNSIMRGLNFILTKRHQGVHEPILLTGYSRGAAGVIQIAKYLRHSAQYQTYVSARKAYALQMAAAASGEATNDAKGDSNGGERSGNFDVEAMLLFDCVNRDIEIGFQTDVIPDNVRDVFHVRRDPRTLSRGSFGNSGTKAARPGAYRDTFVFGTHGAMGGTPWKPPSGKTPNDKIFEGRGAWGGYENVRRSPKPLGGDDILPSNVTYSRDAEAAQEVWNKVLPFLREHHFPI